MHPFKTIVCLCLVVGLVFAVSGLVAVAQPKQTAKKKTSKTAFRPVQSIHDMMEGQRKLWIEIKEGIVDKQWNEAGKSAWILAEVANVNQYQHKSPEYKDLARKMSADCVKLAKLLKKKDESGAKKMVKKVGETCSACHDQFK